MKIYYHPASTTSRPLMLFAARDGNQHRLPGRRPVHRRAHAAALLEQINPNRLVPVLRGRRLPPDRELGDPQVPRRQERLARVSEGPARARARVNEMMDWVNTQLYRDLGYGLVYPQMFPHHKRPSDEAQTGDDRVGQGERAKAWLKVLDEKLLGPEERVPVRRRRSPSPTTYGASLRSRWPKLIRCDLSAYPNVKRWLGSMKSPEELGQGERGVRRLRRLDEGRPVETV